MFIISRCKCGLKGLYFSNVCENSELEVAAINEMLYDGNKILL